MSAPTNQSIALTDASFDSVDASGGVEFRIYYANDGGGAKPDEGDRIDTVILEGAVIPEPNSVVLFMLGALAVFVIGRRRRS